MSSANRPDLRIPKIPVTVEINLAGKEVRQVEIYVAEHLADAYRRQYVADLLATAEQFHPARDVAEGSWALFNKAIAVWIRVSLTAGVLPVEEAGEGGPDELFDRRREVNVEMTTGETLTGDLLYSLPPEKARVVDYLNQGGRFFRLWTAEYLYLINNSYVLRVLEQREGDS